MSTSTPSQSPAPTLVSVRLITEDVPRLVAFYEHVTGAAAQWATPFFAEVRTPGGTIAIGSTRTVAMFGPDVVHAADNRSALVELLVADVDAEHARLAPVLADLGAAAVNEPMTMPWGNRSLLLRDPDGTLVNLFTPVTPEAIAKFRR